VLALTALLCGSCAAPWTAPSPPQARLVASRLGAVRVDEAVTVVFDQAVDPARLQVRLRPAAAAAITRRADRLVIRPIAGWQPERRYQLTVTGIGSSDHRSGPATWETAFTTQKRVVLGFQVDGRAVVGEARAGMRSRLQLTFSTPMRPETVTMSVDGRPLPATAIAWAPDATSASVAPPGLTPYRPVVIAVAPGAESAAGEALTDADVLELVPQATVPANTSTGIGPGFTPVTPLEIVVDNSGPARPQSGLQDADLVYEYLTEYQVTRLTAIYLNHVPELVGPVRSCRMVNPYLGYAYAGITMCSGGSVGTLHWMFGSPEEGRLVANLMDAFDKGDHYFRSYLKPPPHNLYTSGDRAERLRTEQILAPIDYAVDPPHEDVELGGPADAPSVPLHSVSYEYDAATRQYLRVDRGVPSIDLATEAQVQVKNVVLMHVPFHEAGWIEDETGGASSIWYDMLGSGPAEIYSDGRMLSATWHMGAAPGQWYYENHTPVWFTDASGQVILLNSGLTWVHVLGNGQTE
jgi:hypothetical protein